jgi:hypothetical protein
MNANPDASREGLYGGENDPHVLKAEDDVAKLCDAPVADEAAIQADMERLRVADEAAIQAAMERLRVAHERRDLVMTMKSRDGRSVRNDNN